MESKNNYSIATYILFTAIIFAIIYSTNFIFSNLKADFFYKKAMSQEKDVLESEKVDYYRQALGFLTKATKFNRSNPAYYSTKADFIVQALEDNLGEELSISQEQAEELYIRSVQLKPSDFEYHLKLGWFYVGKDDEKAEKELVQTVGLYPTGHEIYFYLMKYYIKQKDEKKIFSNFLLATHYSDQHWFVIFMDLFRRRHEFNQIVIDGHPKWSGKFIYDFDNEEFDFKTERLPHLQIPLKFKVYIKDKHDEVILYNGNISYLKFKKIDDTKEMSVFELYLENFPKDVYLDDFRIRTKMYSPIDRIEVIKEFRTSGE